MSFEEIVLLCSFGGFILILITCVSIVELIEYIKIKKCEKKYPELFKLIKARDEINSCEFWNDNIVPKLHRIDYIINEQKYMSEKSLEKSNIELEELKVEVEELKVEYNKLQKEEDVLLENIESIIKTDKDLLKIMKGLGWCRGDEYR